MIDTVFLERVKWHSNNIRDHTEPIGRREGEKKTNSGEHKKLYIYEQEF